jgi:hypothetical protein
MMRIAKPKEIKDSLRNFSITVGPNPNDGIFQIRVTGFNEKKAGIVSVYDIEGRLLLQKVKLIETTEINIAYENFKFHYS